MLATLATAPPLLVSAASGDWPTYHHDGTRQANDGQQVGFNTAAPDWTSNSLDGEMQAEPLVVGSTVYVATENNTVYALNATTGAILWSYHAAAPVPNSSLAAGCGNVDPVGITGTPVIDTAAGRLYAAIETNSSNPTYQLITVDINTGAPVGSPVTLSYSGFNARTQNQRGALALANGNVYVPFGGRIGDCTPYEGVIIGIPVAGGSTFHYSTSTGGGGAGMWSTGGIAWDGSGNLYSTTGNSGCPSSWDGNDAVMKFNASLSLTDHFAPSNWQDLSCTDTDLGSVAPMLLDNGYAFAIGKEGIGYLLNQSSLGGTSSSSSTDGVYHARVCPASSDAAFGAMAYQSPYVFISCGWDGLFAIKIDFAAKTFSPAWSATGYFSGSPIVAGGAVWNLDTGGGWLHAYDPATGHLDYQDQVGSVVHFATPSAGVGRIFVGGTDQVFAYLLNPTCTAPSVSGSGGSGATSFYFAEGFTGGGFRECLALLMPNASGTATIDYWTAGGQSTGTVALTAGQVSMINVNAVVGANQQVSVRVTLPSPGIVERELYFDTGTWRGSTDKVGVTAPSAEWDFAEGSTLTNFSQYLTLQNPNPSSVTVDLNYQTDTGAHPVKTLSLPATSRTTVEVFNGNTTQNLASCVPNGAGASCGVGRPVGGVSVQVRSRSLPIVAERPFYVNGSSFGSGAIRDGHDAFGATAAGTQWNFAEGTTLAGFNEYLTLQNPGSLSAATTLQYLDDLGNVMNRTLTVPGQRRVTVEVFRGSKAASISNCVPSGTSASCGVGPGVGGVSLAVSANQPIVAERPMYMVNDFGSGKVAGADVVVGATGFASLFGFSALSTLAGDYDYLTIQNPAASTATLTITYYTSGGTVVRTVPVSAHTRHTIEVFNSTEGTGRLADPLGVVISSDVPVLVEKPTYGSNANTYGAADTLGYSPASF